jgi:acyl-CoA synthetase (AMP-forming)/AMP-acid ligase II
MTHRNKTRLPDHPDGSFAALLVAAHRRFGDRPAFVHPDGAVTSFEEAASIAERVVGGLQARGVRPGDRVLIALDNHVEGLLAERAVMLWGLVRVAVSSRLHPHEISYIAKNCGATALLLEERHLDGLPAELARKAVVAGQSEVSSHVTLGALIAEGRQPEGWTAVPGPTSPAAIMYTSGTTGRPKGAVTSQRAWRSMARAVEDLLAPSEHDLVLHAAPFSHFSGSLSTGFVVNGAAVTAIRTFDPETVFDRIRTRGVTCMPLVPTMLGDIAKAHPADVPLDCPTLRLVPYGGSSVGVTTILRARRLLGDVLCQFYGASEALIPITYLDVHAHRAIEPAWSAVPSGRAVSDVEVIVDADPAGGNTGEILVRGERNMSGYWADPGHTTEVLDADGWYRTGDIGNFDADGVLTIVGRARQVIISGGYNVYPGEVERVINAIPGVAEVSVVRCHHDRWGEGVAAVVVTMPGVELSKADIVDACRSELADYKKPVLVSFVPGLPRTSTGKIDTRAVECGVREMQGAAAARPHAQAGPNSMPDPSADPTATAWFRRFQSVVPE